MYAVEFETVVKENSIHIPREFREFDSHNVRVILMMDPGKKSTRRKRKPGTAKGKVVVSDDFEKPLSEEELKLFYQ